MTTIAADFKAGRMVADSKCNVGDTWFPVKKIVRHGAELIGIAGPVKEEEDWLRWYTSTKRGAAPKLSSLEALVLRKEGLFLISSDLSEIKVDEGFFAIGTGGPAARAVLYHGGSLEEAVEIACRIDNNSGGALQAEHVLQ